MLMARGAVVSMLCVIFILPALLMLFDGVIRHTTLGMGKIKNNAPVSESAGEANKTEVAAR